MLNVKEYIETGILEIYALGLATDEQTKEVELFAQQYPEIRNEIFRISEDLEFFARKNAVEPHPAAKFLLMATIDYMERIKKGEVPGSPPELTKNSKISDYAEWLNRKDLLAPEENEGLFLKIIGYHPKMTTAIVWIKEMAPEEVHDQEHERFLIVEGECDILVGNTKQHFVPGDYFEVPLHESHQVVVTSTLPCKVILQRKAA
jgi:mannose-6-phosphate isomerase-like protein (cupin superfamily)